jgi:hypothetical protein
MMTYLMHTGSVSCAFFAIVLLAQNWRAYAQEAKSASVQIVNATSVAAITLRINNQIAYENFPQGLKSADSATNVLRATYEAEDKETGRRAKSAQISYEPDSHQSLVITGDFSSDTPPGLPGRAERTQPGENRQSPPNVLFQIFSHTATEAPVRLRIINGIPRRNLTFVSGDRETVVKPGGFAILEGQPATARYLAKTDHGEIDLLMRQEGLVRNAMLIFFLKNGRPAFVRAFEKNKDASRPLQISEKRTP